VRTLFGIRAAGNGQSAIFVGQVTSCFMNKN
jgi:hypothetical protein